MFQLFNKHRLSEEQISQFEVVGQTLGHKLRNSRHLRAAYRVITHYGNKHPLVVVAIALSLSLLTTGLSVYRFATFSPASMDLDGVAVSTPVRSRYDDSIRLREDQIQEILKESQTISDSIQRILAKKVITREDSIYVVVYGEYIRDIATIINQE